MTNSKNITRDECLRLFGYAYEVDDEVIHPSRVRVYGDGITVSKMQVKLDVEAETLTAIIQALDAILTVSDENLPEARRLAYEAVDRLTCTPSPISARLVGHETVPGVNEERRREILEDWKRNPPRAVFMTEQPRRYFIDSKESCKTDAGPDYYLIPIEWREEWIEWRDLDPMDSDLAYTPPDFVHKLGNSISALTFEQVEDNGISIP